MSWFLIILIVFSSRDNDLSEDSDSPLDPEGNSHLLAPMATKDTDSFLVSEQVHSMVNLDQEVSLPPQLSGNGWVPKFNYIVKIYVP
jgi:hypothetical protein